MFDADGELAAISDALFATGAPAADRDGPEAHVAVTRALAREWVKLEVFRWFAATGRVVTPGEWSETDGAPSPTEVQELFGSWEAMLAASGIEDHALVGLVPRLGLALAKQRTATLRTRQQLDARKRELDEQRSRLDRREAEMRASLEAESASRVRAAEEAASHAREAQRTAERNATDAESRARTAELRGAEAEEEKHRALRRAHALTHSLADATSAPSSAFAAWYEYAPGSFEDLASGAARALAGGRLHDQILATRVGVSDLAWGDGFVQVARNESELARSLMLTHSEPLPSSSSPAGALGAHRRTTISVWEADGQRGAMTQVTFIDAPPVLCGEELARIAECLTAAATPEPDGGWPLGQRASWVYEQEVEELVELLTSPTRSRPVLVLTSEDDGDPADDPERLAAELCGAAHVVRLEPDATFGLTERVGRSLNVFAGAVRCYRPGFSLAAPPGKHPLITKPEGPSLHNDLLLLAGVPGPPPATLPSAWEHAPLPGTAAGPEAAQADGARARLLALTNRVSDLEDTLAERERTTAELAQALAAGPVSPEATTPEPHTVVQATMLARREAQHLKFAPQAFKTAGESPFRPPLEIYSHLLLLDQLAGEYIKGDLGMALGERATQLGLTWRAAVSGAARAKSPDDYQFLYDGHTLELGPHVVVANGTGAGRNARIYFYVSDDSNGLPRGIYIGHIGRHLPDSSTG